MDSHIETPTPDEAISSENKPSIAFNPYNDRPQWDFSYRGLNLRIERSRRGHKTVGSSGNEIYIPRGTLVGIGDYIPIESSQGKYIPGTEKKVIFQGIDSLEAFFSSIGESDPDYPDKPMPEPKFISGVTNERMAKFLQRIGFSIVKPLEGNSLREINLRPDQFEVIGETKEVKQNFETLKQRLLG